MGFMGMITLIVVNQICIKKPFIFSPIVAAKRIKNDYGVILPCFSYSFIKSVSRSPFHGIAIIIIHHMQHTLRDMTNVRRKKNDEHFICDINVFNGIACYFL